MKYLGIVFLLVLTSCGAPHNFINIDVGQDGKNGRNGSNGKDGKNTTSYFYYNDTNLGELDWIVSDVAQIATSNDYKVQIAYSPSYDEWSLPLYTESIVFYPNSACTEGTGYVTRLHSRYASDVVQTVLADNQHAIAMVDRVNLYNDVVGGNSAIQSLRVTGPGFFVCVTDTDVIDTMKLVNNTVFKLNDINVTGWDSNIITMDAAQTEER